jgi:hypothetical protein
MYATGIPLGYLCDTRGPRLNMVIGAFASGGGYYPLLRGTTIECAASRR